MFYQSVESCWFKIQYLGTLQSIVLYYLLYIYMILNLILKYYLPNTDLNVIGIYRPNIPVLS